MRRINSERGASMVEFALILPILLVLLFGIIEFGFLLYDKAMITNAARESARAGILFSRKPETEILEVATNYCNSRMITFSAGSPDISVELRVRDNPSDSTEMVYDPATFSRGQYLRVTTNYNYTFLIITNLINLLNAVGGTDIPVTVPLSSTSIMRAE